MSNSNQLIAGEWVFPTKESPEPPFGGNWIVYRPSLPRESQVTTLWFDPYYNGWSGKHPVAAWMRTPAAPSHKESSQ